MTCLIFIQDAFGQCILFTVFALANKIGSLRPKPRSCLRKIIQAQDMPFLSPYMNWQIIDLVAFRTPLGKFNPQNQYESLLIRTHSTSCTLPPYNNSQFFHFAKQDRSWTNRSEQSIDLSSHPTTDNPKYLNRS